MKNLRSSLYFIPLFYCVSCFFSCSRTEKKNADFLFYNARVYTVDSTFTVCEAFVVSDGKIVETGTINQLSAKFEAKQRIDLKGNFVYPGFIDAHCHFYNYGLGLSEVDLVGTKSFEDVLNKLKMYAETNPDKKWIIGRGWDQNDWDDKNFPTKEILDQLFPEIPVLLMRVDGHAALVNQKALRVSGITSSSAVEGGEFIKEKGELSGLLIDNAIDLVRKNIPPAQKDEMTHGLLLAQANCFAAGLTTVDDAGLDKDVILHMNDLQREGKLKMRVYAMASASDSNFDYFMKNGQLKTDRLNVRSFKFYADGALGSRGACLTHDYKDKKGWKGFLLMPETYFREYAKKMLNLGFQMNTHCIGDSSDRLITDIYIQTLSETNANADSEILSNYRWRIEHAQVVTETDLHKFKYLIPSVQPTHATSDMYWAYNRLGDRVKTAYAYKQLLNKSGLLALGTDFPVEDISPIKTFYAAVVRKDKNGFPKDGFQIENAISRPDAIRGMTIWAAYSNFEEKEKGSIEKGKFADFIVLDKDLLKIPEKEILSVRVLKTFVNAEEVFSAN